MTVYPAMFLTKYRYTMNIYEKPKPTVQSDSHSTACIVRTSGQIEGCTQTKTRANTVSYRRAVCENRSREKETA